MLPGRVEYWRGRAAFRHCCPRTGPRDGPDVLDVLWDIWNSHRTTSAALSALILDASSGLPLTMHRFHDTIRELAVVAGSCTEVQQRCLLPRAFAWHRLPSVMWRRQTMPSTVQWRIGRARRVAKASLAASGRSPRSATTVPRSKLRYSPKRSSRKSSRRSVLGQCGGRRWDALTWDVVRIEWLDISAVTLQKDIADAISQATSPCIAAGAEGKTVEAPKTFVIPEKQSTAAWRDMFRRRPRARLSAIAVLILRRPQEMRAARIWLSCT